jgi:hypothetical protein
MSATHTPGPWYWRGSRLCDPNEFLYAGNFEKLAPTRANHLLIAAAPDLLDALIDLERTAGQPAMTDDPVRVKARAAIAKATGAQV